MVLAPEHAGERTEMRFSGERKFLTSQSRLSTDVVLLRYQIVLELPDLSDPEEPSGQQDLPAYGLSRSGFAGRLVTFAKQLELLWGEVNVRLFF